MKFACLMPFCIMAITFVLLYLNKYIMITILMMVVGITQMNEEYTNETSFERFLPSVHASYCSCKY